MLIGESMNILDLFYHHIIPEAQTGKVNCYFYYNMPFSTILVETNQQYVCQIQGEGILVPTLVISNQKEFGELLIEYVDLAKSFYDDHNFVSQILDGSFYDDEYKICKEKVVITLLLANMTWEDFSDPCTYLRKRIAFLKNDLESVYQLGESTILKSSLTVEIQKDSLNNEAPYQFIVTARGDGEYEFPRVKFGIDGNEAYIYAIQRRKQEETTYTKKINRKLYKLGEGFDITEDNEEVYGMGNWKDVTPSFVVSLNMMLTYLKTMGVSEIIAPSILIERWNAKRIALDYQAMRHYWSEEEHLEAYQNQKQLQSNLTEKFIRTFFRLQHHYSNLDIYAYPMDLDSQLHLRWNGKKESCNNALLAETSQLVQASVQKGKHPHLS